MDSVDALLNAPSSAFPIIEVKSAETMINASKSHGHIPRIRSGQLEPFLHLWSCGESVLVNLKDHVDSVWQPDTLTRLYGKHDIEVLEVDAEGTSCVRNMTAADFFTQFSRHDLGGNDSKSWKIKDWPTSDAFTSTWTDENAAFLRTLPFPAHSSPFGTHNLVAHFARDLTHKRTRQPNIGTSYTTA